MIDLSRETLLSFGQIAKLVPGRGGKPIDPATVWRWSRVGVRAPDGTMVKLECIKIGGRFCSSREALDRFIAATNEPAHSPTLLSRTPARRKPSSERAVAKLAKAGV
jgi:hypothetical protein